MISNIEFENFQKSDDSLSSEIPKILSEANLGLSRNQPSLI